MKGVLAVLVAGIAVIIVSQNVGSAPSGVRTLDGVDAPGFTVRDTGVTEAKASGAVIASVCDVGGQRATIVRGPAEALETLLPAQSPARIPIAADTATERYEHAGRVTLRVLTADSTVALVTSTDPDDASALASNLDCGNGRIVRSGDITPFASSESMNYSIARDPETGAEIVTISLPGEAIDPVIADVLTASATVVEGQPALRMVVADGRNVTAWTSADGTGVILITEGTISSEKRDALAREVN